MVSPLRPIRSAYLSETAGSSLVSLIGSSPPHPTADHSLSSSHIIPNRPCTTIPSNHRPLPFSKFNDGRDNVDLHPVVLPGRRRLSPNVNLLSRANYRPG